MAGASSATRKANVIGVVCGIACAACVALFLADAQGQADQARAEALSRFGGEQVDVCVATRDIAPGETIDASAVEVRSWVAELLPADAVTSLDDVLGTSPSSAIIAGEVLSERRFDEEPALVDVPAGLVAVSVPAADVQAVGGAIASGSRVDVYATGQTTTELICDDVLVLATSVTDESDRSGADVAWITLAVSPDSVQEVVAAAQRTDLYFALPAEAAEKDGAASQEAATPGAEASHDSGAAADKEDR